MKHYVGLDVSLKEVSICVIDADGGVIAEGKVATEPALILSWVEDRIGTVERIVHESGPLSIWLTRALASRGAPVVCIDARAAHKALSARMNKSDRADAEALAQLARTGWYREVHIKSEASDRLRLLLGARERMIRIRRDIEAQARGVLKTYGIRLGTVTQGRNRAGFRDQFKAAAAGDPILEAVAASLIAVHDVACAEAATIEDELLAIARDSGLARRLMTVPGVGPIVALNFIAAIDDAGRFAKATDVGAYLGLTPRRYQSGEIDYSGRISKRGNSAMRTLLFEAANVLITRVRRFSPLKAWAVRLAARKGFRKAAVAAARKIAVVMLRLWRDGTTFAWTKEALPA
jgi:transposase